MQIVICMIIIMSKNTKCFSYICKKQSLFKRFGESPSETLTTHFLWLMNHTYSEGFTLAIPSETLTTHFFVNASWL